MLIIMKIRLLRLPLRAILATAGLAFCTLPAAAQGASKNPTGKFYVADLTGQSDVGTGDKMTALVKNGVHAAEGSVIQTRADSTDALVLSNGTALFLTAESRIEVKRFFQEPFTPNRADLDVEPSVSQTVIRVARGAMGVCTSRLIAGSSMVYQTPHGTINVRGRRLMIETEEAETRVSLLEGDVTVLPEGSSAGEVVQPGFQAVIRKASPSAPATLELRPIPNADNARIDEAVSLACISRRTVFFETVEGSGGEIAPVRTAPATLPTQFTVSPARIDG